MAWLRQSGFTPLQNDSSEAPGCRPAQEREGMGKKGLSAPTPAAVKGDVGGRRVNGFLSLPIPFRFALGSCRWPAPGVLWGEEPGRGCPSPGETQAGDGDRGPGQGCGGDAVICLLLCGRRNLVLVLITSAEGTTTKIIQQTSVHPALFWCRSCRWHGFLLFYIFYIYR